MARSRKSSNDRAIGNDVRATLERIDIQWTQDHDQDGPDFVIDASDATFVASIAATAPADVPIIGTSDDNASYAYALLERFQTNGTVQSACQQHGIGFLPTPELGINPLAAKWSRERITQALARYSVANSVLRVLSDVAPDEHAQNRTAWVTALSGNVELLKSIQREVRETNSITHKVAYIASKVSMTHNPSDAILLASMAIDGLDLPETAVVAMTTEIFNVATLQYRKRTVSRLTRRLQKLMSQPSTDATLEQVAAVNREITSVLASPAPFVPTPVVLEVPALAE